MYRSSRDVSLGKQLCRPSLSAAHFGGHSGCLGVMDEEGTIRYIIHPWCACYLWITLTLNGAQSSPRPQLAHESELWVLRVTIQRCTMQKKRNDVKSCTQHERNVHVSAKYTTKWNVYYDSDFVSMQSVDRAGKEKWPMQELSLLFWMLRLTQCPAGHHCDEFDGFSTTMNEV